MQKSDTAIWIFSADLCSILWRNAAAEEILGDINLPEQGLFSSAQLTQIKQCAKNGELYDFPSVTQGRCSFICESLPDGCYLFTQAKTSKPASHKNLISPSADKNQVVSVFDQTGELLTCSPAAEILIDLGNLSFDARFTDLKTANKYWQKVCTDGFVSEYIQVKTVDGFHWHFLILEKQDLSSREWVIKLTEYDADNFLQQERGLQSSLREQEVIFENAGTGICYVRGGQNHSRKILRCNQKFADIYGYEAGYLIGESSQILYKDTREFKRLGSAAYPLLLKGELYSQRCQMRRKDGSLFWAEVRGKIISTEHPELGFMWVVDDIDDYIQANKALENILREQSLILDYAMVGIVFLRNRTVTRCNQRFEEIFGYETGALTGSSSRLWYLTDEAWEAAGKACYKPLANGEVFQDEMMLSGKGGRPIWCDVRSKAIDPSDLSKGSIWITMDITERKRADEALLQVHEELEHRVESRTKELADTVKELHSEISEREMAEERVKHMALHDALTGLPNRVLMEDKLTEYMHQSDQQKTLLAVLFIDLDRFKLVNDSWGHHEGDQLLSEVADRLKIVLQERGVVARVGGDEFVILLPDLQTKAEAQQIVLNIQSSFTHEVHLALRGVYVTPSIGACFYPQDGNTGIELLKNADAAMYQAKDQGRNCIRYYERGIDDDVRGKAELGNALVRALKNEDFELYYQPQLSVEDNKVIGAEALIRWHHAQRGVISPVEFIPLAEETGLIVELGYWILQSACRQLSVWEKNGLSDIVLSVNLSSLQVQQPNFAENVFSIIDQYRINPGKLELELTESVIMRNTDDTIRTLDSLHERGIKISVDDFGTGYSSLSYLKRLPLDKLKIDRSFVNDITTDPDDALICRTIISMAKNLNLQVIAEGVETDAQLQLLREYGCELYQGYLFSKPVPIEEATQLLRLS